MTVSDGKLRVLLVEDSPRIAERVRDLLESEADVRIVETVSEEDAAIAAARRMPLDIMILDLRLARGTGFGVLRALGAQRPATIVMTNYALDEYRARAADLGVEYFLDKAADFDRLPEIIEAIRRARVDVN